MHEGWELDGKEGLGGKVLLRGRKCVDERQSGGWWRAAAAAAAAAAACLSTPPTAPPLHCAQGEAQKKKKVS